MCPAVSQRHWFLVITPPLALMLSPPPLLGKGAQYRCSTGMQIYSGKKQSEQKKNTKCTVGGEKRATKIAIDSSPVLEKIKSLKKNLMLNGIEGVDKT